MQVNLVFLKKDGTTSSFLLPSTVTFIGRRQDCDFCIPLTVVSRRHCEINLDSGKITVRDLASRNGTLVNGEPIEEAQVKAGDILKIGPVEFVVQVDGVPADFSEYLPNIKSMASDQTSGATEEEEAAADAQEMQEQAAAEKNFAEAMPDLSKPELGGSQTEMLGDLSEDFNFDEDFNL